MDLGTLGGNTSVGLGINNFGAVTGFTTTNGASIPHAFLYSKGVMTDLGTLGGPVSVGYGINDFEDVTGYAANVDGSGHAFLYSNGVMTDLGTLGGTTSVGYGIDNSGQVTGGASTTGGVQHAFLYSNGIMTDLTAPGDGDSYGRAVNSSGEITGDITFSTVTGLSWSNAFLYSVSGGVLTDLNLGAMETHGLAINGSGQVTGFSNSFPGFYGVAHAFLYNGGVMTDLGALGGYSNSIGTGINAFGSVTGYVTAGNGVQHAFVYSNGVMTDLNSAIIPTSGWTLLDAFGINDLGQITGVGTINGETRAFLLNPATPQPATFGLLSSAIFAFFAARHRRS